MSQLLLNVVSKKSVTHGGRWRRVREIVRLCIKKNKHTLSVKRFEAYLFKVAAGKDNYVLNFLIGTAQEEIVTEIPRIKGISTGGSVQFEPYEINSYRFIDAIVTQGSDLVRLHGFFYWYKKNSILYSKLHPEDIDFLFETCGYVAATKPVLANLEVKCAVSLLGVHDGHWGHFLVQYYPRLNVLKQYIKNEDEVTVLIPETLDKNCTELLKVYLEDHWKIYRVPVQTSVRCKKLYYADPTAWISECYTYPTLEDYRLPKATAEFVKSNIRILQNKYLCQSISKPHKRIYLRREGRRSVINIEEIDEIFSKLGFEVLHAHECSLEEKINTFWNAEIIAGPFSSGFINSVFCKKGAKLLCLSHLGWAWESLTPSLASVFGVETYVLTGVEKQDDDLHASFWIDPKRLQSLLEELLIR